MQLIKDLTFNNNEVNIEDNEAMTLVDNGNHEVNSDFDTTTLAVINSNYKDKTKSDYEERA